MNDTETDINEDIDALDGVVKYTILRLKMQNDRHNKFYTGFFDHTNCKFRFRYGKIGATRGSWTDAKEFDTVEDAYKAFMSQLKKKVVKGYETEINKTLMRAGDELSDEALGEIENWILNWQHADDSAMYTMVDNVLTIAGRPLPVRAR